MRGAGHVQEGVGAARLRVLAGRRAAAGRGLAPDLRRRLGLGQARLRAVARPGLAVQLLLLLLAAVAHGAAARDARGLGARGRPPPRRRRGLHGRREGFHTRGGGSAYRLRALRTSVRSHGRDDTEAASRGRALSAPSASLGRAVTCCIADYEISALLNATNCEFFHEWLYLSGSNGSSVLNISVCDIVTYIFSSRNFVQ